MVKVPSLGSLRIPLREMRKAAGLTQEVLAERSGVRQGSISKMEQDDGGSIERVGLEILVRLAHGLGLASPLDMFTWEEGPRYRKWQTR